MNIVDHAHFQEEQRAYYQGMLDVIQIFDGLGIIKKSNKITENSKSSDYGIYRNPDQRIFLLTFD